jgi:dienelactone hydrolase
LLGGAAFALAATPAASAPATPAASAPATPADAVGDACVRFLTLVRDGRADEAVRMLDATMSRAMSARELASTWSEIVSRAGPLKTLVPKGRDVVGAYDRRVYRLEFEREPMQALLVFDPQTVKLAGLFFTAVPATVPAASLDEGRFVTLELRVGPDARPVGASVTIPRRQGPGPFPGIVLVPGSGPGDRDETVGPIKPFRDLAEGLAARGMVALRFDKRTRTYPASFIGSAATVDGEEVDDAVGAIAKLRALPEVDPKQVFVVGHSLGGFLAPEIARRAGAVAGLVLVAAPAGDLPRLYVAQLRQAHAPPEALREAEKQLAALEARKLPPGAPVFGAPASYWYDLGKRDPVATARALGLPVLLLRGDADQNVPASAHAAWAKALAGKCMVKQETFPGLTHHLVPASEVADSGTAPRVPAAVIDAIVRFVAPKPAGG